jgi:hypothetical protein
VDRAFVYKLTNGGADVNSKMQPFKGKFFIEPINQTTQVGTLSESADYKVDVIRFFVGANLNAIVILICYVKTKAVVCQADVEKYLKTFKEVGSLEDCLLSKVFGAPSSLQTELPAASKFLRNTNSLGESDFAKVSNLHISADAHGVAIVGNGFSAIRFERACQSVALCCAYRSVLDDLICDLSEVGRSQGKNAEDKLKEWAYFMSAFYFVLPIRQNTIELCEIYSAVNNRQKLVTLANEATAQLQLLAKLVRLKRTEEQARQDKKFHSGLTYLGLIIAVIGALQIVQITPKTLIDFCREWAAWVF